MFRIVIDRIGGNTRVFHDNVEVRGLQYLEIHPIDAQRQSDPVTVTMTVVDVRVEVQVDDSSVSGVLPKFDARQPVTPVAPARPVLTRARAPVSIGALESEAAVNAKT